MDNTSQDHILQLLQKQVIGEPLTREELHMAEDWLARSPHNRQLWEDIKQRNWLQQHLHEYSTYNEARIWDKTISHRVNKRPPIVRRLWSWQVAASIILVLGIGAYFWITNKKEKSIVQQDQSVPAKNDVQPGRNKAVLTLSDGRKITLDEAANGQLAQDGGAKVVKSSDGKIIYNPDHIDSREIVWNTMTTPRGGQYQLTLPDGSKVWLNAASSITYPTVFTGQQRMVSITGEAYFEVTKNKEKPFIVKAGIEEIRVLGTEFNVNAYTNEPAIKTSLVNGAVWIDRSILKPGQAYTNGKVTATNIEQDIAWKNGAFDFNGLDFVAGMRQLERWYDIRVVYDGPIPREVFYGEMDRNLTLQEVLELLGGIAKFRLEGKTLHVSQ